MAEVWIRAGDKSLEAHSPLLGLEIIYDTESIGLIQASEQEGVPPLSFFVSMNDEDRAYLKEQFDLSEEDKAALVAEFGLDPKELEVPNEPEQWFDPAEGLRTVQALLRYARALPPDFETPVVELKWIVRDLQELEQFLVMALARRTRFYIVVGA